MNKIVYHASYLCNIQWGTPVRPLYANGLLTGLISQSAILEIVVAVSLKTEQKGPKCLLLSASPPSCKQHLIVGLYRFTARPPRLAASQEDNRRLLSISIKIMLHQVRTYFLNGKNSGKWRSVEQLLKFSPKDFGRCSNLSRINAYSEQDQSQFQIIALLV